MTDSDVINYDTVDLTYTADLQSVIKDSSTKAQDTVGINNASSHPFFYVHTVDY